MTRRSAPALSKCVANECRKACGLMPCRSPAREASRATMVRTLRALMEHIYALFDRRCQTQTALGKLQKLRAWVKRCTWIGET